MSAFAPGIMEKGLATVGGGQMRDALTSAQDTYYNSLKDKDFNNPFSLSESEQAFIDNFDNRGDFRPPMDSNDVVGSQGYDFSPTPPPTRGIQHWTNPEDLAGMEAEANNLGANVYEGQEIPNEVAAAESIVPPQWDDFNRQASMWNTRIKPAMADLFAETNIGGVPPEGSLNDAQLANRAAAQKANARWEAQGRPSGLSRIGDSISNWWNNLNSGPSLNDRLAAAPVNIDTNVPRPQTQDAVPYDAGAFSSMRGEMPEDYYEGKALTHMANVGDGFGEAGTEMDIPAPPPPTSGSVRMPTQGMSQVGGNPSPGFWQQILNRVSGKDPNKPFTGNPPPPSSGSVRMPTQNLGN
jgi:hypothetical protein